MRLGLVVSLGVAAMIFFTNLGTARLWDRDEPRNAQCAREMFEANEWIVPTFDGQLRSHKPVLLYWGEILAYRVLGVSEFSARLPSALAGWLTVALVYVLARRLAAPDVAAWSAVSLSSMVLFAMAARAATPDALLILSITLAMTLFVRSALIPVPEDRNVTASSLSNPSRVSDPSLRELTFRWPCWWQWGSIYGACGLAVLAKGLVGIVLPGIIILGTTLWIAGRSEGPRGKFSGWVARAIDHGWKLRPVLAIAVIALVAGPWYLAVGIATDGEWLKEFFWTHHYHRAVSPLEGHDGWPLLYYLGALLVGTFPWSCFAIPMVIAGWRQGRRGENRRVWHPLWIVASVWILAFIGVFSCASTKLPSYIAPSFPAAALVSGWFMAAFVRGTLNDGFWLVMGLSVAALVGMGSMVAIAGPLAAEIPTARPLAVVGIVFLVASLIAIALVRRQQIGLGGRAFAIGGVSLTTIVFAWGPAAVDRARSDLDAVQAALENWPDRYWTSETKIEPSWVFYSNRRIRPKNSQQPTIAVGEIRPAGKDEEGSIPVFPAQKAFFKIVLMPGEEESRVAQMPSPNRSD